jgi:DNA-binding transcriptional ArsR family regulator
VAERPGSVSALVIAASIPFPRLATFLGSRLLNDRSAVLEQLGGGEQRVTDLVAHLRTSQPNVSGHLACLKDCGLG